jgi:hypothetical protein
MRDKYAILNKEAQGLSFTEPQEADITGLSNAMDVYAAEVALAFYEDQEGPPKGEMVHDVLYFMRKFGYLTNSESVVLNGINVSVDMLERHEENDDF